MKKVLSMLLVLAMLLPGLALADTVVDLGIVQVSVPDTAYVDTYEKAENSMLALIIPNPDNTSGLYANINVTWGPGTKEQVDFTAQEFGEYVLSQTAAGLALQGIAVTNEQLIRAEMDLDEGFIYLYFSLDADYTGAGVDLVTSLYMAQQCLLVDGDGMYTFTYTAATEQELLDLVAFLDDAVIE